MPDFKLSAQLAGHSSDVRAVAFPHPDTVISTSRDCTVRVWRRTSASPPAFDSAVTTRGHAFINSLAYLPPTPDYPEGLVVSAGHESLIEVRRPTAAPSDNAERLLIGHGDNVCALDVSPEARRIVSGGWDGQCRVWRVGKWETDLVLHHDAAGDRPSSVWAVLFLDETTVVTGCADANVRIFDLRTSSGGGVVRPRATLSTPAVVRALCKLPSGVKGHPSGADFASAGNDGVVRLWKLSGQQLAQLTGHTSFVYALACLPSGEIASSSEDRTVRIWSGTDCVQTITHPALSVWSVAACSASGDIATGASDGVVRVFTRSPDRVADADALAHYHEAVRSSAIPQQQLDDKINRKDLPGPEWLHTNSGTKDGQVKLINEPDGSVSAHQWSISEQQWLPVGTVVGPAGGGKVEYEGQQYDYVFDVDIEDGKPPLKLPFNLTENPYDRAARFITDHDLPASYVENVAKFIIENTPVGATGAVFEQQAARAREAPETVRPPPPPPRYLPHTTFLAITQAKFEPIQRKILSLNADLVRSGQKDFALNPTEEGVLAHLVQRLSAAASENRPLPIRDDATALVLKLAARWPYANRLPGLDLLRCMTPSPSVAAYTHPALGSIVRTALSAALEPEPAVAPVNENSAMMALRAVANLFATPEGRAVAAGEAATALTALERLVGLGGGDAAAPIGSANRNLQIALTTVTFNYACLAYIVRRAPQTAAGADAVSLDDALLLRLCHVLWKVVDEQRDPEVLYRALMSLGMLLLASDAVVAEARARGDADVRVGNVANITKDNRVRQVAVECERIVYPERGGSDGGDDRLAAANAAAAAAAGLED